MSVVQRQQVLSLYKRILGISKTWVSKSDDPAVIAKEKTYIRDEARTVFKNNKNLTDPVAISDLLREGEARVEIALHYRIPYPRPMMLPKMAMAIKKGKKQGAFQERLKKQVKSTYIKSVE